MTYNPTSTNSDDQYYANLYEQQMLEWEAQYEAHEAMQEAQAEEAEEAEEGEEGILSEEEAEKLINDYIRSDWSAARMEDLPF